MWRNISVQAVYQLTVQMSLLWFGVNFLSDCTDGYGTSDDCQKLQPNGQVSQVRIRTFAEMHQWPNYRYILI